MLKTQRKYKSCSKCSEEKPKHEYHKAANNKDGLKNVCKKCVAIYKKMYREENKALICGYNKDYYEANCDSIKIKVKGYQSSHGGRLTQKKASFKYIKKNPIKIAAQNAVKNALKTGRLAKPSSCSFCGETAALDGHHNDYSYQLDVAWLCRQCHKDWHKENGPGLNGGGE